MTHHTENGNHTHHHTAGVIFHEEGSLHHHPNYPHHRIHPSPLTHFVIKYSGGMITSNTRAAHVLIFIAVLFLLLSVGIFWIASRTGEPQEVTITAPEGYRVVNPRGVPPHIRK